MFETHDSARLPFLAAQGEHFWSYVSLYFNFPWFLAEYQVPQGQDEVSAPRTVLLSSVAQLTELLNRKDVALKHVELSSPSHMNGAGTWKVEPLREIRVRTRPGSINTHEYVFLLESGKCYAEHSGEISAVDVNESTVIFAIN